MSGDANRIVGLREARLERVAITRLNPAPYNPRKMDPKALERLKKSIQDFGFAEPVVARERDGLLIGGHQRLEAARALGLMEVPCAWVEVTDAEAKALNVALNNPSLQGTFDPEKLAAILAELKSRGEALMAGYDSDEVDRIIFAAKGLREGLTDPDEVPEPPETPTTRVGELYVLGDHRVLCGDSSKAEDLDRLLSGDPVHLVNTDPPYNVGVQPRSANARAARAAASGRGRPVRAKGKLRAKDRPLENDHLSDEEFARLLRVWFGNTARVLQAGRAFYLWGGYSNLGNYPGALAEAGLYFSQCIIWVKQHPVMTRKDFMGNHEWCFYGWRAGAAHYFDPEVRNEVDVWTVKKVSPQKMVHLTEKPVELAARAIRLSSRPGEVVLDLFGGSGSTLIAAEQAGRRARLMEIDAAYCDVIVQRWEAFTGEKAKVAR